MYTNAASERRRGVTVGDQLLPGGCPPRASREGVHLKEPWLVKRPHLVERPGAGQTVFWSVCATALQRRTRTTDRDVRRSRLRWSDV